MPARQTGERFGRQDDREIGLATRGTFGRGQGGDGIDRPGRAVSLELDPARLQARLTGDSGVDEGEPGITAADRALPLVGRDCRRHDEDPLQAWE